MDRNKMTAKQYLSQAYRLDERINSKLEQLGQLKMMVTTSHRTFPRSVFRRRITITRWRIPL